MKIILKNLKQMQYIVELESEKNTIKDLKNEIEKLHGFDSAQIKLLFNGKVLADDKTLEEYQIKNENVIIMMNTKLKAKENPQPTEQKKPESSKEEPKKEEQPKKEEEKPKTEEPKPKEQDNPQINQLVDMGYERAKAEQALSAAKGSVDLAIEYLNSGNIPVPSSSAQPSTNQQARSGPNVPLELRRYASFMKVICRDAPERIYTLLNTLKSKNPALLNRIKEREEDFKQLLVSPVNQEDIDNFKFFEQEIGNIPRGGQRRIEIPLSQEEREAINRLKELGFSESDAIQAYIACDKNEELAANYLFEQKQFDENENNKNPNQ